MRRSDTLPNVRRRIDPTGFMAGGLLLTLMMLLSFQWITLANLGGFTLKLPYGVFLVLFAAVALSPRLRAAMLSLLEDCGPWLVCFFLYLLIIMAGFYGTHAQGSPIRQVFFALGSMATGACVMVLPDLRRTLRLAGLATILVFLTVTEIVGRQLGTSWIEAVSRFLSGDLGFVIYSFLRAIYRGAGDDGDETILASEKNAISAALFLAFVLFRLAGPIGRSDWLGVMVTPLLAFLLLMLNTRSVLLPLVIGLAMVWAIRVLRNRHPGVTRWLLAGLMAAALLSAVLLISPDSNPFLQMLEARFSLGDSSSASRAYQYIWAMSNIESALWTGSGYIEIDGQPVHNLFVAALLHGGVATFVLTISFYLIILGAWLRFVFRVMTVPGVWVLPLRVEWVVMLPLLPLIRVWLVGDSGHPALSEWLALAIFFALRQCNRRALLRAQAAIQLTQRLDDSKPRKHLNNLMAHPLMPKP